MIFASENISANYCAEICLLSMIVFLFVYIILLLKRIRLLNCNIATSKKKYSTELAGESLKMSEIVRDLKDSHLKLLESGKMSALASLSTGILHQISQPITALNGVSSFLKSEMEENDQYYKAICLMDEQSTVLRDKLNDILELIKSRKIHKEILNVNDIVPRVMSFVMDELRIKHIKWEAQLDNNMVDVFADSVHMQQIFINLITNAIQALDTVFDKDSRYLVVSTKYDKKHGTVDIGFYDTGPEITEEDEKHIFEPFFPVISTRAGIGLALCKDLIDEHSGKLNIESPEEGGAKFTITLPEASERNMRE